MFIAVQMGTGSFHLTSPVSSYSFFNPFLFQKCSGFKAKDYLGFFSFFFSSGGFGYWSTSCIIIKYLAPIFIQNRDNFQELGNGKMRLCQYYYNGATLIQATIQNINTKLDTYNINKHMPVIIKPISANLIKDADGFGKADPYVKLQLGQQNQRTMTCNGGGKSPQWTDTLQFQSTDSLLRLQVWDKDTFSDDLIGQGTVNLNQLYSNPGRTENQYVDLVCKGKAAGRLLLSLEYQGPPMGGNQGGWNQGGQSNWGNQGPQQSNWGNQGPNQGGNWGNQGPNQGGNWGNQGPNQGGNWGNGPNQGPNQGQGWGNQGPNQGNNGWGNNNQGNQGGNQGGNGWGNGW